VYGNAVAVARTASCTEIANGQADADASALAVGTMLQVAPAEFGVEGGLDGVLRRRRKDAIGRASCDNQK
jgi:hypothetical protein